MIRRILLLLVGTIVAISYNNGRTNNNRSLINGFTTIVPITKRNVLRRPIVGSIPTSKQQQQQQRTFLYADSTLVQLSAVPSSSSSSSSKLSNMEGTKNTGRSLLNTTAFVSLPRNDNVVVDSVPLLSSETQPQQHQEQHQEQQDEQPSMDVPKSIQQQLEEWLVSPTVQPPLAADTSSVPTTNIRTTKSTTSTTETSTTTTKSVETTHTPQTTKKTVATVFGHPIDLSTKERNYQLVHTLKGYIFDVLYSGTTIDRSYARFYALETIARMPYFSYLSVLHLYETLGLWRQCDQLKIHFCESWNELHHLLIMESLLGNNIRWLDRFIAQHIAFVYYWIVVVLFMYNPVIAYNLNQNVEEEAYGTYDKFLSTNEDLLKTLPAPTVAIEYYTNPSNLYMFDSMHHNIIIQNDTNNDKKTVATNANSQDSIAGDNTKNKNNDPPKQQPQPKTEQDDENELLRLRRRRRPQINNLYDVFVAIRDDEMEHVKTMEYYQN